MKISFFLLKAFAEKLSSTQDNITFFPNPSPFDNENFPRASNPMPYPEYDYLSGSAFLVNLPAPNKELLNAK